MIKKIINNEKENTNRRKTSKNVKWYPFKYPYQFYAYGSRAKGSAHKFSDLDICYFNIPKGKVDEIKEELTESDLPFFVELVSWDKMRPAFQENIKKDLLLL